MPVDMGIALINKTLNQIYYNPMCIHNSLTQLNELYTSHNWSKSHDIEYFDFDPDIGIDYSDYCYYVGKIAYKLLQILHSTPSMTSCNDLTIDNIYGQLTFCVVTAQAECFKTEFITDDTIIDVTILYDTQYSLPGY